MDTDREGTGQGEGAGLNLDDLMASQIDYYRAHAPNYDDWWRRTGKHDLGQEYRLRWEAEISTLDDFLADSAPFGDVLEFAGGTGNWTAKLVPFSESITVVDASPEAVALARKDQGSESQLGHRGHFWVPTTASLRHRLFLLLAESCSAWTLRPVLGARGPVPVAHRPSVLHRQRPSVAVERGSRARSTVEAIERVHPCGHRQSY